jgi:hypothetical protein
MLPAETSDVRHVEMTIFLSGAWRRARRTRLAGSDPLGYVSGRPNTSSLPRNPGDIMQRLAVYHGKGTKA